MTCRDGYERQFYVVKFLDLPFRGIDNYVCVPHTWIIVRRATKDKSVVSYPKEEDPLFTRYRVERKERYNDEWKFYIATVKYESDSYNDAELWIAKRNYQRPLVKKESQVTETQPRLSVIKEVCSANQNRLPNKGFQLDESAQSSSATQPQQRQIHPNHLNSQQQPQIPKLRIGISIKPKNKKQMPSLQGVTKRIPPQSILTKVLNSIRQALSTNNNLLSNNPQLQARMSPRSTGDNNVGLTSPQNVIASESSAMSRDEAPGETTNNVNGTANHPGNGSADRPTAAQNSTARSHQMNPKFVLEQQMLDNFATLFTQMGSTLRYTTDMYDTLRSSILDTAKTYKKVLGAVEQFNSAGNPAGNASPSSNLIPNVPQSSEKRHTEVTASASSSNQDQRSHDVANKKPKNKHKELYRFVLPPEYDAFDSRWTLKYRTNLPGLVDLVPQSGVFVSYGDLKYCQEKSKDCKSLALRLLTEVFNRDALSICSSMRETAEASNSGSTIRPDLDDHACSVLLNFVLEHGLQRGWNTDLKPILSTLHRKQLEIRFRYGIMVEC